MKEELKLKIRQILIDYYGDKELLPLNEIMFAIKKYNSIFKEEFESKTDKSVREFEKEYYHLKSLIRKL